MKKFICLFVLCLYLSFTSQDAKEYVICYQKLTSGKIFHIETKEGERIAKVLRDVNKGSIVYSFLDLKDKVLANGISETHQSDTSVFLTNDSGEKLGWFSAEIYNIYPKEYRIYTKNNCLLAKGFMNWLGSGFVLFDPDIPKRYLVNYNRPMFKLFNDYWHFEILEDGIIDFRILCFIGVFQAACDLNFEKLE